MSKQRALKFSWPSVAFAACLGVGMASVLHGDNPPPLNPGTLQVTLMNLVEMIDSDFKSAQCPSGFSEEDTQTGVMALKNCTAAAGDQTLQLSEVSTGKVIVEKLLFSSDAMCDEVALRGIFLMLDKGKLQDDPNDLDYLLKGSDIVQGIPGDISVELGCTRNSTNYHALITDKAVIGF